MRIGSPVLQLHLAGQHQVGRLVHLHNLQSSTGPSGFRQG